MEHGYLLSIAQLCHHKSIAVLCSAEKRLWYHLWIFPKHYNNSHCTVHMPLLSPITSSSIIAYIMLPNSWLSYTLHMPPLTFIINSSIFTHKVIQDRTLSYTSLVPPLSLKIHHPPDHSQICLGSQSWWLVSARPGPLQSTHPHLQKSGSEDTMRLHYSRCESCKIPLICQSCLPKLPISMN